MGSKTISIYTDGGVYSNDNLIKWAFLVVKNGKIIHQNKGRLNGSGQHTFDVETAESEAIYRAVEYIKNNPANYTVFTDSRSAERKIHQKWNDHTRNPVWIMVQRTIEEFRVSPLPISFDLKWKPRRSDEYSKLVDDLCEKEV